MGKTVTRLLLVAAAIAVNAIPGVGQFLSAALGSAALATSVISAVTLAGLQAGASLAGLGPGGVKPETTEISIKTPRPPRVARYGRGRLYGASVLFETAPNGSAVDVYAIHDGEVDGVEAIYLNDDVVTLTGDTVNAGADGRYKSGAIQIFTTDGTAPGAGFPAVEALLPGIWSAAHRGDGVFALAQISKAVKAKAFTETYPASSVPTPSVVARWQRCPDPAALDPLDEAGWTWTECPVRQLLHYKLVREGPRPLLAKADPGYAAALAPMRAAWWGRKIAPTLAYWIAAAADCDSPRPLAAGGTEPKYRSAVAHKLTDQHKGPTGALLATFDGWLSPRADGALVVYSGKYYAPTVSIGPEHVVSYSWDGGAVDDDAAFNTVVCAYESASHDYNLIECDSWRDEADISRRGQELTTSLEMQVPSPEQVRYLAKRLLARHNEPRRGTVSTNIAGRIAQGHRFINLHLEEAGAVFYSGPVEILGLTRAVAGGVSFQWVAVSAAMDDWDAHTEGGGSPVVGDHSDPEALTTPDITDASADEAGVLLTVDGPVRDDLTWFVRWRYAGATIWGAEAEYSDGDPGPGVLLYVPGVPHNADLEFSAQYAVGDGRRSDWAALEAVSTPAIIYDGGTA